MESDVGNLILFGFEWLELAIIAPVLFVLFLAALHYGKTTIQQFVNLICGMFCSLLAIAIVAVWFKPPPGTWAVEHYSWIMVLSAAVGAAIGVLIPVLLRSKEQVTDKNLKGNEVEDRQGEG